MSFYDSDLKFEFARSSNEYGTHGPGTAYYFDTDLYSENNQQYALSPFLNIGPLNMAYPMDATEGQLDNDTAMVKRLTFQVGTLRYPTNPDPLLLKFSDPFMLMDFNTADLYTRKKSAGEWEGLYPQYERAYAGDGSWEDDAETIRPVKGTPFRIRKIPICVETTGSSSSSEGESESNEGFLQGYYYTLATAPFIITSDGEASTEEGYLGAWDPDDPKAVQLTASHRECGAGYEELPKVTGEDCIETYVKEINGEDYVVVTDKYKFEVYPDECSSGALEIIQSESDCTIQFKLECQSGLTSGDVSGIVTGYVSGFSGYVEKLFSGFSGYVEERLSGLSGRIEECCTGKLDLTLSGLSGIISGMISGATGSIDPSRLCITGDDAGCIETRIEDDCIVIKDKTTYVGGNWIDITKIDCQYTFDTNTTDVYNWLINNNFFPNSKPVVGGDCTEVWEVEVGGVDVYQVQGQCIEVDGCITANVVPGQPGNNLPPEVQLYVPCVSGQGCIDVFKQINPADGKEYQIVSGQCPSGSFITGTGCTHTWQEYIEGNLYTVISGECGGLVTGEDCIETYTQNIDGKDYTVVKNNNTFSEGYGITITKDGCDYEFAVSADYQNYVNNNFTELETRIDSLGSATGITGSGCVEVFLENIDGKHYTVVSTPCLTGTGCVEVYQEEINGTIYSVISGACSDESSSCAGGAGANNFSINFAGGGATGTAGLPTSKYFAGAKITDGGIYNDTPSTNLVYETYTVTGRTNHDTESPPGAPTYNGHASPAPVVCDGQIYTSNSWSFGMENACYKVIDAAALNSNPTDPEVDLNSHHVGPYEIGDKGDYWELVECCSDCDIASNNFTQFKSITGSGFVGTYETTFPYFDEYGDKIGDAPYIAITGHACLLTGCNYSPIQIDLCSGGETITIEVLGRRVD